MNKIDETSKELEYSSGWKKMIKDTRNDRINEEFKAEIEDLQFKLGELNSSITNLRIEEKKEEKGSMEYFDIKQIIIQRLDRYESNLSLLVNEIKNMGTELNNYKKLIENQNSVLESLMEILNCRGDIENTSNKGLLANIFKKK